MQATEEDTPAALGFRMPAEWEKHEAAWIGWPHNPTDWPGKLEPIHWVYGEIARKIAPGELVRILVNSSAHEAKARSILKSCGVDMKRVEFFRFATNRGWTRDFGPIFVKRARPRPGVVIARFRFNAWARYPDWKKDDAIPEQVARRLKFRVFRARVGGRDVVLEGGSIDVNGQGTLLTTEECLLSPVQARNPGLKKEALEKLLGDVLGVRKVLWLGEGIVGDDTHGHVDDLSRFVDEGTVVTVVETKPDDANYKPLQENLEILLSSRDQNGHPLRVVTLPMPAPVYFDGQRLPASYANFYIANRLVIVPTFTDPQDRAALNTIASLFPSREVVGIPCRDLVLGLGTLHCMTQQQPAAK